jgi:hypothetical protein
MFSRSYIAGLATAAALCFPAVGFADPSSSGDGAGKFPWPTGSTYVSNVATGTLQSAPAPSFNIGGGPGVKPAAAAGPSTSQSKPLPIFNSTNGSVSGTYNPNKGVITTGGGPRTIFRTVKK